MRKSRTRQIQVGEQRFALHVGNAQIYGGSKQVSDTRSRVLDSHRAHIPRTGWGHCRSLNLQFSNQSFPPKDSGSCLGF
jgi:hypothetical protein